MARALAGNAPDHLPPDGEQYIRGLLTELGEDTSRAGLRKTPERVWTSLWALTRGYERSVEDVVGAARFEERCDEMVSVRDIEFYSLCEHHLLPFFGYAHVAY